MTRKQMKRIDRAQRKAYRAMVGRDRENLHRAGHTRKYANAVSASSPPPTSSLWDDLVSCLRSK